MGPVPDVGNWVGLVATIVGTGVSFVGLYWSYHAAQSAERAEAAIRRVMREVKAEHVLDEIQELQLLMANSEWPTFQRRCTKVSRWLTEMMERCENSEMRDQLSQARAEISNAARNHRNPKGNAASSHSLLKAVELVSKYVR
jgi:hypothetical protein